MKNDITFGSDEYSKHKTFCENSFAYEQKGDWYYWQMKPHDFPVINEDPRPYSQSYGSSSLSFSPVTVHNNWPEKLENASIFPYLMGHSSIDSVKYGGFCEFVQEWYKSSCAVVYYSDSGESKIIGSGSLIGINDKNLTMTISTARHNFEYFPIGNLYARFFQYQVTLTNNNNWLQVCENYLDVPICDLYRAVDGLDAGYLISPLLQNSNVFFQYAKVLHTNLSIFDGNLSDGQYAMFHFAGGKPQISIGNVETTQIGSDLFDTIAIQAGPGASGAAIIQKSLDRVRGGGISIYRMVNGGYVVRRIINFSQFNQKDRWIDEISAPYNDGFLPISGIFQIISPGMLEESGYEFLRWLDEAHGKRRGINGDKFSKPKYDIYKVENEAYHSTHHIIPIDNMLYLWDYFYRLDEETCNIIRDQVKEEASFSSKKYNQKLDRKNRYSKLYKKVLERQYGKFHLLLDNLCPSFYEKNTKIELKHQKGFAWSLWNLFKGWNGTNRIDDPAVVALQNHSIDFSEKTRPKNFNEDLWEYVKALNDQIQILKKIKTLDTTIENNIYLVLLNLEQTWKQLPKQARRTIYSFNEEEWKLMGKRDGHSVYRVKPSK